MAARSRERVDFPTCAYFGPKLLLYATPGGIIDAAAVAWCEEHLPNVQTVDIGEGIHYLQEDKPHLIGEELAKWYQGLPG